MADSDDRPKQWLADKPGRGLMNAVLAPEDCYDFRNPRSVAAVFQERSKRLARIKANPERLPRLQEFYRDHLDQWITDWTMTYDTRNGGPEATNPTDLPFILFPKQCDWVRWTVQNWKDSRYGGTQKSRDVGLSWLFIALSIGICTLYEGISIGWGSYKQEKVDKPGDIGSLFEKGRFLLDNLPPQFRAGYDRASCSRERLLRFPHTNSTIIGEIGDNIGRGGRTSIYFVDEAAYLEHDEIVDQALSKNTPCRQDVSSVRGMENTFAQRMHDGFSRKFTFHWRDNPLFTEKDYEDFKQQWGEVTTAQELDINYSASVDGIIIPSEHVQASIDAHKKLNIEPSGVRSGALDVADGGRDLCAFAGRHGNLLTHCSTWRGKGSNLFVTTEKAFLLCDELRLDSFCYDADNMGASVRGDSDQIRARRRKDHNRDIKVNAFRGSAEVLNPEQKVGGSGDRTNKDYFQNLKAQCWHQLASRFKNTWRAVNGLPYDKDAMIFLSGDIPELSKLCIELSQPQWRVSLTGKMMVDKVPDGKASPNMGDAVMMLFSNMRKPMRISDTALEMHEDY